MSKEMDNQIVSCTRYFLSDTLSRAMLLRKSAESVSSPSMDGMPKATGASNSQELKLINAADAAELIRRVNRALDLMDDMQSTIIRREFMKNERPLKICMSLYIPERTFYRKQKQALLSFAYSYNAGQLVQEAYKLLNDKQTV
ncbi:hypothetical protein [Limosilactobacillus agrestimuris]|uniref:hypothetical protein n=1 Tax=Limosilactobacillus agrestimuris TaxID=2941331 RepID=UPI00203CBA27|nr:hypothetical protein [Limosilactobacillus agrestimuris]